MQRALYCYEGARILNPEVPTQLDVLTSHKI
jgi:hypothetical protein